MSAELRELVPRPVEPGLERVARFPEKLLHVMTVDQARRCREKSDHRASGGAQQPPVG